MQYWNKRTYITKISDNSSLLNQRSAALYEFLKYFSVKDISIHCEWQEGNYYHIFLAGVSTENWFHGHIFKTFYEEILKSFPYERDDLIWIVDGLFLRSSQYKLAKTVRDKLEIKFYRVFKFWLRLRVKSKMVARKFQRKKGK